MGPGRAKAIVADNLLRKQQLLIVNRYRKRASDLSAIDRVLLGFQTLFLSSHHIKRSRSFSGLRHFLISRHAQEAWVSTAEFIYQAGIVRPQGPIKKHTQDIIELTQHNTCLGCRRLAQQIDQTFGLNIDKDGVRRVLEKHYHPHLDDSGSSKLNFI